MFTVMELKYDPGKILIGKKLWILEQKQQYNKTEGIFCYWSPDLNESRDEMRYAYSQKFTGEPALFKVFILKLTESLEEAQKGLSGRVTTVAKRFRDPGNTDEEIKKMEAKKKRLDKKELKVKQAEALARNIKYLVDTLESDATSTSTKANESECIETVDVAVAKNYSQSNNVEQDKLIGQLNESNAQKDNEQDDGKKNKKEPKAHKARTNAKSGEKNLNKMQLQQPSTSFACYPVVPDLITSVEDIGPKKESKSLSHKVDHDKIISKPYDNAKMDDDKKEPSVQREVSSEVVSIVMIAENFVNEEHLQPPFKSDHIINDDDLSISGEMVCFGSQESSYDEWLDKLLKDGIIEFESNEHFEVQREESLTQFENVLKNKDSMVQLTVPELNLLEPTLPEPDLPEPAVPEPAVPEPAVPEPAVPEPAEPELIVSEPSVPEPVVHVSKFLHELPYDEWLDKLLKGEIDLESDNLETMSLIQGQEANSDDSVSTATVSDDISKVSHPSNQINACNNEGGIVILDFDKLTKELTVLKAENKDMKSENDNLKIELAGVNKRNIALQDHLVAVNERVPETLFVEKDGGRLYRGDVFVTKDQCAVLDRCKNDRKYMNCILLIIFRRGGLKDHSVTGKPSNKTKEPAKRKLDETLLKLVYDIMDARSLSNRTKRLKTKEKNEITAKKISNLNPKGAKKLPIQ